MAGLIDRQIRGIDYNQGDVALPAAPPNRSEQLNAQVRMRNDVGMPNAYQGRIAPYGSERGVEPGTLPGRPNVQNTAGAPIDRSRPILENPDGSFSTERTITIEMDGKHIIIPTIVNGKQYTPDQAVQLLRQGINKPVGVFDNAQDAEAYAVQRSREIGSVRQGDRVPRR